MKKPEQAPTQEPPMPQRIPRKVRRQALRDLEKEGDRLEKKIKKAYARLVKGEDVAGYRKESEIPYRKIKFFDEKMLDAKGTDFTNPMTGEKERARLHRMVWLEKTKVKHPNPKNTDETISQESYKQVNLTRDKVRSYEKGALDALKKAAKKCKDNNLVDLLESTHDLGDLDFQDWNQLAGSASAGTKLPFPPGPYTKQLYIYDQWLMISRAINAYNYNPVAHAGIETKTDFIVGTGPRVIIKNDALKEAWSDFDRAEDFTETLRTWESMFSVNGERFVEMFVKPNGDPTVRSIDPGTVYEIITEPRDIRTVYGYRLMYQTQYQIFGEGAKGEQVPLSEWIYETIKPDNVIHQKLNVQDNEKRGRSDLLSVLWVCQLLEDYVRYKVILAMVQCAFVWDIKLNNADQPEIDAFKADEETLFPKPNSSFIHNENVERTPMQFKGAQGGAGSDDVYQMLVAIFSVGIRVPKEYMGAGDATTRANAITATEPVVKHIESRRQKDESLIKRIVDFVATTKGIQYKPEEVEVSFPEVAPENVTEKINNVLLLKDRMVITMKRMAEMITKELGITNYDFDQEIQAIAEEMTDTDPVIQMAYQNRGMGAGPSDIMPDVSLPGEKPTVPTPKAPSAVQPELFPSEPKATPAPGGTSISNNDRKEVKVAGQVK